MSKPENPLNYYRSYAYHHILIAANSTDVLNKMASPRFPLSKISNSTGYNNRLEVQTIPGSGDYIVLIDGTQDADFFISDLTWETVMVPQFTNDASTYTTMGIEGTIKIIEPKGARFLQHLNHAFDMLQCDPIGITFILKTIFIGYPGGDTSSDTGPGAQTIVNVTPMGFTLYDIISDFKASESTYDLSYVGSINGAAKLPAAQGGLVQGVQSVRAYDGRTKQSDTLLTVMNRLTKLMNEKYVLFYDRVRLSNNTNTYQRIEYDIKLVGDYNDSDYIVDDFQMRAGENVNEGVIAFAPGSTIEQAIDKIMQSCKRVLTDAKPSKDGGTGGASSYVYKIHSTIDSSITSPGNGVYRIVFVVTKYKTPQATRQQALLPPDARENSIEFDYLYTGNNTDVLDFNLKMDTGLMFLMMLTPKPTILDGDGSLTGISPNAENDQLVPASDQYSSYVTRVNTPLFPQQVSMWGEAQHSSTPSDKLAFRALLNRHAFLSAVDAKITIKGNPNLFNELIITPEQLINGTIRKGTDVIMSDWTKQPGLVRVNLRMPVDEPGQSEFYTEPFWYQGYYQIISIKNIFSNGDFTQEMEMIALPQDNDIKTEWPSNYTAARDKSVVDFSDAFGINLTEYNQSPTPPLKK